jgi:hypothetical protein
MPTQDENKDVLVPSATAKGIESTELNDGDLEAVTGGLGSSGSSLSSGDTGVCISSD